MSAVARRWVGRVAPAFCALALACLQASNAGACPLLPSTEEIARLKTAGRWDEFVASRERLEHASERRISEAAALELLDSGYGLPTYKLQRLDTAGDMRVNFDGNDVIDERDILGLGYCDLDAGTELKGASVVRRSSVTMPLGTLAAGTSPRCLVLLIKFTDQAPTDKKNQGTANDVNHDSAWAHNRFFELSEPGDLEDASVAHYYKRCSYGRLELSGDVFHHEPATDSEGWITSAYTRAQVAAGTKDYDDVVLDALQQADPYIDYSDYDSNGDGFLDGLITLYAGADGGGFNQLWYFRWLQSPELITADGVRISSGVWSSEQGYLHMFCHEFGHELGLPDLYDVNGGVGSGNPDMPGAGYWTLMAHWTEDMGRLPPFLDAFCRAHLRFAEPVDVPTTSTPLSLSVNRATSAGPENTIYRVWRNGAVGKQCFLVEHRDSTHGFDAGLLNSGLLIWHVDEGRTSGRNLDNAFNPQRLWLECAGQAGDPFHADNTWYSGFNGDDAKDFFDDTSTPSSRDSAGVSTGVRIDPTSANSGPSMTFDVTNNSGSLPTASWISPAAGATVSGSVTVSADSNAGASVSFYVNGCLKHRDASAPHSFSWDTRSAPNGPAVLRAVALNGSAQQTRVIERSVTVDNSAGSGRALIYSDSFDAYSGSADNALLGEWNLHGDGMGLEVAIRSDVAFGGTGKSIAFTQTSFPGQPPTPDLNDANAGIYQGQDDEWLMSPRISLAGFSALKLKYKAAFRGAWPGEATLTLQISTDEGASWTKLESLSYLSQDMWSGSPHDSGHWDEQASFTRWAQRQVSLDAYADQDVFIRFFYLGGQGYNIGMALDDFEVAGIQLSQSIPDRNSLGKPVTLVGAGFGASQGGSKVRFSDGAGGFVEQSSVTSWSPTQVVCSVPAGAKTGEVWLLVDGAESPRLPFTVILQPPTIGGVQQR